MYDMDTITLHEMIERECTNLYYENDRLQCRWIQGYNAPLNNETSIRTDCCAIYNSNACPYFEEYLEPLVDVGYTEYTGAVAEYHDTRDPDSGEKVVWKEGAVVEQNDPAEEPQSEGIVVGTIQKPLRTTDNQPPVHFEKSGKCKDCGKPKRKGHTYCSQCAQNRQRARWRKEKQKQLKKGLPVQRG